jgi:hypothetical protein
MNRYLSQHKRQYPSPRLEVLLKMPDTRLVSSDLLNNEFGQGRIPIYVLDRDMMTESEKRFAVDPNLQTLWVTKRICDVPIYYEMTTKTIGTDRTLFRIWSKPDKRRRVTVGDSFDKEIASVLNNLLSIASFSNVSQQELMVLAECMILTRWSGNHQEFPFTKLMTFDQGIILVEPTDILTCAGLRKSIRDQRSDLEDKIMHTTVRLCNRLFKSIKDHPEYPKYQRVIQKKMAKWRQIL